MFGMYRHFSQCYDTSTQIVALPWGEQYHVKEYSKLLPVSVILGRHKFALRMKALGLTTQEDAVIRALVIVASGS